MDSHMTKTSLGALAFLFVMFNLVTQSKAQNSSDPCAGVQCQQGDCVVDPSVILFGYQCQCRKGWSKIIDFPFFACGIPDCQLNFSCDNSSASAPSVAPAPTTAPSVIPLDFCSIANLCGPNGHCVSNTSQGLLPTYSCDCNPGSENLFNMSIGLCLPTCNLQGNCQNLGLPLTPPSPGTPSPPGTTPSPSGVNMSACANVDCWQGSCEPALGFPPYSCKCTRGSSNLINISSLPCIPDCHIYDSSCGIMSNTSNSLSNLTNLLDPCNLPVCGGGQCISSKSDDLFTVPSYNCSCNKGYSNFLNKSSGICLSDCCLPQCLGPFGGCGESPPPIYPFSQSPFAPSPNNTSSTSTATPLKPGGRMKQHTFSCAVGVFTILSLGLL